MPIALHLVDLRDDALRDDALEDVTMTQRLSLPLSVNSRSTHRHDSPQDAKVLPSETRALGPIQNVRESHPNPETGRSTLQNQK